MIKTGLAKARFLLHLPVKILILTALTAGFCLPGHGQSSPTALTELYDVGDDNAQPYSPQLLRIRTLVKANVLDLAQSILETQSPPDLPTKEWMNWQRQLWALYRIRGNWAALYQRTRQIPPAFPMWIHREADIQAICALIKLNSGKTARHLLRQYLLSGAVTEWEKRRLRKLMVESYLTDNLLHEASIAMKNYQVDYRSQEEGWLLLSAQIYLRLNDADAAVNLLAPLNQPAAKLLRIYSRLKNQSMTAQQAIDSANTLLPASASLPDQAVPKPHQVRSVIIYARQSSNQHLPAVDEMEQFLIEVSAQNITAVDGYPHYSVADLMDAYAAIALGESNENGLLVGDTSAWFDFLISLADDQIILRKAISGYLLKNVNDGFLRKQLNNIYIRALIQSNRVDVIPQIYGDGKPFGKLALSADVGLALSNFALANGNIRLAAEVNKELVEVPQGMERRQWLLHVARIAIIAGDYAEGAADLMEWIEEFDQFTPEQTDQVLQPIFDLQTVNQHSLALELLHQVYARSHSVRHMREIAYWIAQSYQATRQHLQAADYFLFSALQKDNGFDQWGESARYQAAESLLSANLVADSRVLFSGLLTRATEAGRKQQLRQKLQELRLLEYSIPVR